MKNIILIILISFSFNLFAGWNLKTTNTYTSSDIYQTTYNSYYSTASSSGYTNNYMCGRYITIPNPGDTGGQTYRRMPSLNYRYVYRQDNRARYYGHTFTVSTVNTEIFDGSNPGPFGRTIYNEESCPSTFLENGNNAELEVRTAFDEDDNACDDVTHPDDPFNLASWSYGGTAQEASFGTETIQCTLGVCPVSNTISEFNRNLDTLVPESGTNGSQQGNSFIFIYDANTLNAEARLGEAGAAGLNDIDVTSEVKYCFKKSDADTDGINSEFARTPFVSFRKYNWRALTSSGAGNSGVAPVASTNGVKIFKKLDSSVRYLLKEELL